MAIRANSGSSCKRSTAISTAIRTLRRLDVPLAAIVLQIAIPTIAFWSVLVRHDRSFYVYPDNVRQIYPWFQKFASAVHHGYLPLWDANVNAGNSFVGEIQTGLFYPINLLVVTIFGTSHGISIAVLENLVILHFVIASFGTYLFCRTLGTPPLAAAFAGILFSYSGPHANRAMAQVPIFFTYSLLPFVAYFALRFAQTRRLRFAAIAGIVVGMQVLAGHFAAPFLATLIAFALIVAAENASLRLKIVATCVVAVGAFLVGSPQIFFGFQHLANAYRIVGTPEPTLATAHIPLSAIDELALQPSGLLTFFDPVHFTGGMDGNGIFIGVVPIVILLICLAQARVRVALRRSFARLWALYALAILSLILAVGIATPIGLIWYSLPLLSSVVRESGRYVLVFQFVISVICGSMLGRLQIDRPVPVVISRVNLVFASCLVAYVSYVYAVIPELHPVLVALALAVTASTLTPAPVAMLALIAIGVFETTNAAATIPQSILAPTYAPTAYRDSPVFHLPEACYPTCRVVVDTGEEVPANIGDVYAIQTIGGYTALTDRNFLDFLRSDGAASALSYDFLNARYLITTAPVAGMVPVARDRARKLLLYERPTAYPRAFTLDSALHRDRNASDVRLRVLSYTDVEERFLVRLRKPDVVVFSEQFYPGWRASVDGTRTTLFVAGIKLGPAIFRAVRVPAGTHVITFRYLGL